MKKVIFALSTLLSIGAWAQSEGEVVYTTKIDMHAMLPEDDPNTEMIKGMMPQYQETKSTLLFTATESLYGNGGGSTSSEAESLDDEGNGMQIEIRMDEPEENIYTDVANGLVVEQRELMDKKFLIKDTIDAKAWKMTSESKNVSGLNCMKATMKDDEGNEIEAWFTPQIPVSSGPAGFGGLPGLIVHLSLEDGNYTITASNIVPRKIEKGEIIAPKKGKTVTREKFEELQKKKMEQMAKEHGGEGGIIIRTEER